MSKPVKTPSSADFKRPHKRVKGFTTAAIILGLVSASVVVASPAQALGGVPTDPTNPNFGPNVKIFDPSSGDIAISTVFNQINNEAEFSTNRYAVLLKPGSYNLNQKLGYYNTVSGLGAGPDDVTINGALSAYDNPATGNALNNFWRGVENVKMNPIGGKMNWAVSQASPMRRVNINGNIQLCGTSCGYTSGGYLANSNVSGEVISGSQQQWFTRNSSITKWTGGVWNMVFSGVNGAPADSLPNTVVAKTPVSREKPYLFLQPQGVGAPQYAVYVPKAQTQSSGHQWSQDAAYGSTVPITNFYITQADDTAATMNAALSAGKNLLITPGIYHLSEPLKVNNPDQIIMGLGMATLIPDNGTAAIDVPDFAGVSISGIIIDAGAQNSPTLLNVGSTPGAGSSASNPTWLSDVFFRIGGLAEGKATTSLQVDSDNVLLDDTWAWRADHGTGVGWTKNTADTGVIVNGDNVTAMGLFAEHYQKNQVVWNGNGGTTIFYQSETPYDVPNQAAWMDAGRKGYSSYFVSPNVTSHSASGLGIYSFFNPATQDAGSVPPQLESAIQTPKSLNDTFRHITTFNLDGNGGYNHVINDTGNAVPTKGDKATVEIYPGADTVAPVVSYAIDSASRLGNGGWYTSPVSFTTTATDDFVGAVTVEANIDAAGYAAANGSTTVTGDGVHTVKLRATDSANNVSAEVAFDVKIDTQAPVTTATPTGRSLSLSSVDASSGLERVEFFAGDSVATASSAWLPYSGAISVGNAATIVSYRATDRAGNVETIGSYSFASADQDTTPPTAPTVSVATGSQVSGTAEAGSTVKVTTADGTVLGSVKVGADGAYTIAISPAVGEGVQLKVTATDAAGNTSLVTAVVTTIKTTSPLTVKFGAASYKRGETATVTATGYASGEVVSGTMYSTPRALGSSTANASGVVTFTWTIPQDIELGTHSIVLSGTSSGTIEGTFEVVAAAATDSTNGSAAGAAGSSAGVLQNTGADTSLLSAAALMLLLAGAVVMRLRRRNAQQR